MTPTLAYLLGLVTLPGMVLGLGAALYVCDRVAGWWRGPVKRWQRLAREAGAAHARVSRVIREDWRHSERIGAQTAVWDGLYAASLADDRARRWARWAPWWPA